MAAVDHIRVFGVPLVGSPKLADNNKDDLIDRKARKEQLKEDYHVIHGDYEIDRLVDQYKPSFSSSVLMRRNIGLQKLPDGHNELKDLIRLTTGKISVALRGSERKQDALQRYYFQRALAYEKLGRYDLSYEEYSLCIHVDFDYADAYFNRAGISYLKKNVKMAIEDINKAIAINPRNLDYLNNRMFFFRELKDFEEAAKTAGKMRYTIAYPQEVEPSGNNVYRARHNVRLLQENPLERAIVKYREKNNTMELLPLVEYIKGISLFSRFSQREDVLYKIAEKIEMHKYVNGKTHAEIYSQGAPSDYFYIIIEGEVQIQKLAPKRKMRTMRTKSVFMDDSDEDNPTNSFNLEKLSIEDYEERGDKRKKEKEKEKEKEEVLMELIPLSTLQAGMQFGMEALELLTRVNSACVMTTPLTLLALAGSDYHAIIEEYKHKRIADATKLLLSSGSAFRRWPLQKIQKIAETCHPFTYAINEEILTAGTKPNSLYMIRSGVVKVMKGIQSDSLVCTLDDRANPSSYCELPEDESDCTVPGTRLLSTREIIKPQRYSSRAATDRLSGCHGSIKLRNSASDSSISSDSLGRLRTGDLNMSSSGKFNMSSSGNSGRHSSRKSTARSTGEIVETGEQAVEGGGEPALVEEEESESESGKNDTDDNMQDADNKQEMENSEERETEAEGKERDRESEERENEDESDDLDQFDDLASTKFLRGLMFEKWTHELTETNTVEKIGDKTFDLLRKTGGVNGSNGLTSINGINGHYGINKKHHKHSNRRGSVATLMQLKPSDRRTVGVISNTTTASSISTVASIRENESDLVVLNLMSGQVIGEVAVLAPTDVSPVSVRTCSVVEIYAFDADVLFSLGIHEDEFILQSLRQSLHECNPSVEDIVKTYKNKIQWEREKAVARIALKADKRH